MTRSSSSPLPTDYLASLGPFALTARLKRLSDAMTHEARALYRELGLEVEPSWYLVFSLLEGGRRLSVTEIASALGWSHPTVVALTSQLVKRGFVELEDDPADGRRTLLTLSKEGRAEAKLAKPVWEASRRGLEGLVAEAGVDVLGALDALDRALARKGYGERAVEELTAASKRAKPPKQAKSGR